MTPEKVNDVFKVLDFYKERIIDSHNQIKKIVKESFLIINN